MYVGYSAEAFSLRFRTLPAVCCVLILLKCAVTVKLEGLVAGRVFAAHVEGARGAVLSAVLARERLDYYILCFWVHNMRS